MFLSEKKIQKLLKQTKKIYLDMIHTNLNTKRVKDLITIKIMEQVLVNILNGSTQIYN